MIKIFVLTNNIWDVQDERKMDVEFWSRRIEILLSV